MRRVSGHESESGAALVLVIGFMLMIGTISAAVASHITSGVSNGISLANTRNRQYDADAAIEYAVTQVRQKTGVGPALVACGGSGTSFYMYVGPNNNHMRVDCQNVPTLTTAGLLQRNVIFEACVDAGTTCDSTRSTIIRAQVNFETAALVITNSDQITHTFIQSWSVS